MKILYITALILSLSSVQAQKGRVCNGCPGCGPNNGGFYVSWPDTTKAAAAWCRAHAGKVANFKGRIDDGAITGYKSNKWNVGLYGQSALPKRSCNLLFFSRRVS